MITLTTTHGDIVIELNDELAPKTCANFTQYVADGFFDGTIFHRVIENFMIQGGGMTAGMSQKADARPDRERGRQRLNNERGTVAMARTTDPHSATAQFFINVKDNDFLDSPEAQDGWGYCVFGQVTEGMDVVDKIKGAPTTSRAGHQDVPVEPMVIERASVD